MSAIYLHLILNHIPVLGTIFCLILMSYAIISKNKQFQQIISFLLILISIISFPVFFSGHNAHETLEKLPEISKDIIEKHEDAALPALIAIEVTGVLALTSIIASKQFGQSSKYLTTAVLALSLVSAFLLSKAAYTGGHIRHPEIKPGFKLPATIKNNPEHKHNHDHNNNQPTIAPANRPNDNPKNSENNHDNHNHKH